MHITRRQFATIATGAVAAWSFDSKCFAQSELRYPVEASLQPGDFLWPKKPGAIIIYEEAEEPQVRWLKQRDEFVESARSSGDDQLIEIADNIAHLSYNDFRSRYLRNLIPGQQTTYGLGDILSVGHVGIVEVDTSGQRWVIEALWGQGVMRTTYKNWLKRRPGEIVWHGRLKKYGPEDRGKIAVEARKWLYSRYDFWNFNLMDTSGFYCSKLVWYCVMKSLRVAIDGNNNPNRIFWLSPKQILYSDRIHLLNDPGRYSYE